MPGWLPDAAVWAWALLAAALGRRGLLWWDAQAPPPGPSVFDEPQDGAEAPRGGPLAPDDEPVGE
jgi:hypothetical protein